VTLQNKKLINILLMDELQNDRLREA
jgi:hypothetical protein